MNLLMGASLLALAKSIYYSFYIVNYKYNGCQSRHKIQEHFQFKTLKFRSNSNIRGKSAMSFPVVIISCAIDTVTCISLVLKTRRTNLSGSDW